MVDDTSRRLPDYLTTAEAAAMLAVTTPRVRALISSGDLPAVKVCRAWLVQREAVEQRVELEPGDGRQFVPARAWGLLFLADGLFPDWLSPQDRWRLSAFLPRLRSGDLRSRMTRRGQSHGYHAHTSLIDRAREDPDLLLTGPSASEELHLGLVGAPQRSRPMSTRTRWTSSRLATTSPLPMPAMSRSASSQPLDGPGRHYRLRRVRRWRSTYSSIVSHGRAKSVVTCSGRWRAEHHRDRRAQR
jgi:excisionase family DNA binding protein